MKKTSDYWDTEGVSNCVTLLRATRDGSGVFIRNPRRKKDWIEITSRMYDLRGIKPIRKKRT